MEYKKYHRKYPDTKWNFKAISTKIRENGRIREVIYYKLIDKDKRSEGVEIYSGRNYIVGSSERSYSRRYSLQKLPEKYKKIVEKLIIKHKSTKWSNKAYVNLN